MKKLTIATGLLIATTAYAQTEVLTGVTRGKDYGVVYTLPKTQIELEIKANKIRYTPGEFSKYANRYLRLNNVSTDPEEYWELTSVKVTPIGVPNGDATYFVKLKDKTVAPLMELTENGIIKSINVPYTKSNPPKAPVATPTIPNKVNPRDFLTEEILIASSTACFTISLSPSSHESFPNVGSSLTLSKYLAIGPSISLGPATDAAPMI